MATAKDCHALTSHYIKVYTSKYGTKPVVNRNTARWGFDSILYDMTVKEAYDLVDYYLETNSSVDHSLQWFFNNYDRLLTHREDAKKDAEHRRRVRQESEQRVKEWREKRGK